MELFGLEDSDVEDFQYQNLNGNAQISVGSFALSCPECGCKTQGSKIITGRRLRTVFFLIVNVQFNFTGPDDMSVRYVIEPMQRRIHSPLAV